MAFQQPTRETSTSVVATIFKCHLLPVVELPGTQGSAMAILCGICLSHCGSEESGGVEYQNHLKLIYGSTVYMSITPYASIYLPVKWTS